MVGVPVSIAVIGASSQCMEALTRWCGSLRPRHIYMLTIPTDDQSVSTLRDMPRPSVIILIGRERIHLILRRQSWNACPLCLEEFSSLLPSNTHTLISSEPHLTRYVTAALEQLLTHALMNMDDEYAYSLHTRTLIVSRIASEARDSCPLCKAEYTQACNTADALKPLSRSSAGSYRQRVPKFTSVSLNRYFNPICGLFGKAATARRTSTWFPQVVGMYSSGCSVKPGYWSGSGSTFSDALSIGICEGFERYSGCTKRSHSDVVVASLHDLGVCALNPTRFGKYETSTYSSDPHLHVFSEEVRMRWQTAYSVSRQCDALLPLQTIYYGLDLGDEPRYVYENSNGSATGSTIQEAVLHGLLELIERDAFMLYWVNRISPVRIAPQSIRSSEIRSLIARLRMRGMELFLLDMRSDLGIPSFIAVLKRKRRELGYLSVGIGCDFDLERAIKSAIYEAARQHNGFAESTRQREHGLRRMLEDPQLIKTMFDHAALYGLPDSFSQFAFMLDNNESISLDDLERQWACVRPQTLDFADDIRFCLDKLQTAGLNEMLIVGQTSTGAYRAGLRSVRVFVPGILPIDFGYSRMRCYSLPRVHEAPLALGIRQQVGVSRELNRFPHPFS